LIFAGHPRHKAHGAAGLLFDLIGHFSAGIDPVALECDGDGIEVALLDSELASKSLNHLPVGMRIFQVHVKRWSINSAYPVETSFTAPEFHAALVVRIKNPHAFPLPKGSLWSQLIPIYLVASGRIRASRGRRANVIDSCNSKFYFYGEKIEKVRVKPTLGFFLIKS